MKPQHLSALRKITTPINVKALNWCVTGSLSFSLRGLEVEVDDIDIQTDLESAYVIQKLLNNYVTKEVQFSSTDRIRSHFGTLEIDGVRVEIMGDVQKRLEDKIWEVPINPQDHLEMVKFKDMEIPVLTLAYEYQAYLTLGRFEKAAILKQHLQISNDDDR
jgi:hypothetical protein